MSDDQPRRPLPPPSSPDSPDGGIRGRVTGVTRIGSRAFILSVVVICGLLLAILYGVNRRGPQFVQQPVVIAPSAPPDTAASQHFGQNIPLVTSTPAPTPPPPLLIPPTPVPSVQQQSAPSTASAPSGPSAQDRAEQQREAAEAAEEQRQRDLLLAAYRAPILAQGVPQLGGSNVVGGRPVQVAYAGGSGSIASDAGYGGASMDDGGVRYNGTSGAGAGAPQTVAQNQPVAGGTTGSSGIPLAPNSPTVAPSSGPQPFLNGPFGQNRIGGAGVALPNGAHPEDFLQSQRFSPLTRYELVASSVIPAALVTGIDSELPGLVTAIVREDVYDSKTGKYLLVPKGSKLIGVYNNSVQYGQSRVLVAWQRMIFPDTTSIDLLNMPASDVNGGGGVAGTVDNHFGQLLGAALLTSVLAAGVAVASGTQNESVFSQPTIGQTVGSQIAQNVSNIGTQLTSKSLNIPPTLHIAKGYPFLVVVDRDMVFNGPYRGQ